MRIGAGCRCPVQLYDIITHPAGRAWAGASANHVFIIKLEGGGDY